jgi:hypothetical protein
MRMDVQLSESYSGVFAYLMATSLNPRDQVSEAKTDAGAAAANPASTPFLKPVTAIQSQRLKQCIEVFRRWLHFPNDYEIVKILLGTVAANYMPGRPVWLMIVGPSSCGKTELVNSLSYLPHIHWAGDLTKPGLLSGKPNRDGDMELTGGLLHEVGEFGFMLFPEFSSVLSVEHRSQDSVLGLMRQIYDGRVTRSIGSEDGAKHLMWTGKGSIIAASAPGIDSKRHMIQEMGERFIYKRLEFTREDRDAVGKLQGRNRNKWQQMRGELAAAVKTLLLPVIGNVPTIELADTEAERLRLLSDFSGQCRSAVERNTHWERQAEETHQQEVGGGRLFNSMSELFAGMLAIGCVYADTWTALENVMWDSVPYLRTQIIRTLARLTEPGSRDYVRSIRKLAEGIADGLSDGRYIPERAVARAAEDLAMQGVVEQLRQGRNRVASGWRLSEDTWLRYAQVVSEAPLDPRKGLLGAATGG